MKTRYLVAAAAAALALGSAADASIYVSVVVDGTQLNLVSGSAVDAGTGLYNFTFVNLAGNVTVGLQATGKGSSAFSAPDPQFATQALTVDANGGGTHTVKVLLSQIGLTSSGSLFSTTNSLNTLNAGMGSTASAAAYIGTNTAYNEGTLLGSILTCAPGGSCDSMTVTNAPHTATFGETVEYNFTLTSGRVQANTQIGSAVPEPASWGLMVLGFGVIGGALRTSRRKVSFA